MSLPTNRLKDFTTAQIEATISKAVTELTGSKIACEISSLKYADFPQFHGATLALKLREPLQSLKDIVEEAGST